MINQTKHTHARLSWRALSVSFIIKEWAKSRCSDHVSVIVLPFGYILDIRKMTCLYL